MEIKRKLATIQIVEKIAAIPKADNIVSASFSDNGWNCVMKKGVAVGDKVVFFEIDSLLPKADSRFAFMGSSNYRVKTAVLRGSISQGLAMPMEEFDEIPKLSRPGLDVTDKLKVKKHTVPLGSFGEEAIGVMPGYISKTDEERIENMGDQVQNILNVDCYVTEKLDGTSATFYLKDGEYGVAGRRLTYKPKGKSTYALTGVKYNMEDRLKALGRNLAIQGEICGPGIQKNRLELEETRFFIFTIQDLDTNKALSYDAMQDVILELDDAAKGPTISCVPLVGIYDAGSLTIDKVVERSRRDSMFGEFKREGVVVRTYEPLTGVYSGFKVINPEYLIRHKL